MKIIMFLIILVIVFVVGQPLAAAATRVDAPQASTQQTIALPDGCQICRALLGGTAFAVEAGVALVLVARGGAAKAVEVLQQALTKLGVPAQVAESVARQGIAAAAKEIVKGSVALAAFVAEEVCRAIAICPSIPQLAQASLSATGAFGSTSEATVWMPSRALE